MFEAIKFFTEKYGNAKNDKKAYFEKKKYTKEQSEKILKWIKYHYLHNNFEKWNHKVYMQVFEWALNENLPKEANEKAQSLTMAYITYMITNAGERKLPSDMIKNLNKFYKV
jgi:hypothetical protein